MLIFPSRFGMRSALLTAVYQRSIQGAFPKPLSVHCGMTFKEKLKVVQGALSDMRRSTHKVVVVRDGAHVITRVVDVGPRGATRKLPILPN